MDVRDIIRAATAALKGPDLLYWDLRHIETAHERFGCRDRVPESGDAADAGVGVRALVRGATGAGWGFASTNLLEPAALARCGARALETARASAVAPRREVPDFKPSAERGEFRTPVARDPFAMPRSDKEEFVRGLEASLDAPERATSRVGIQFKRIRKRFVNSAGADLFQEFVYNGVAMSVTLRRDGVTQTRGYPAALGNIRQGGFEAVEAYRMGDHVERIVEEAREILGAPDCPSGIADVVIGPEMLGLVVHEVCGHAAEFDRVLGEEAAYAGRSFVTRDLLGKLQYGSGLVNLVSDPTYPGSVGSYGWDDDGTPAHPQDLVRDGRWVGYLTGRENAGLVGMTSAAANRASNYDRMPINRMTSVNFLPGDRFTRDEIIGRVERGYWIDDFCGWSINADRNGFRFSVEDFREIRDGQLGRRFRNGAFSARTTPAFWGGCFAVAKDPPYAAGYDSCAKGQPVQLMLVGHVVPRAAAFHEVKVGK